MSHAGRILDQLSGLWIIRSLVGTDVPGDAFVEQECFLSYQTELSAQAFQGNIPNVMAIDENGAVVHIIESQQQRNQSSFSGSVRPHYGDAFAFFYRKGNILQYGGTASITEVDGLESNVFL